MVHTQEGLSSASEIYYSNSCFNQHNAVEFEYHFACTRKCVHLCYAALLPRRGQHIASHSVCPSVCLSVCPSVPLSLPSVTSFRHPLASWMYFSARTEGRISYGHLGRTNSCFIMSPGKICSFRPVTVAPVNFKLISF